MGSAEISTTSVYLARPWPRARAPLTVEQVYQNAREILAGATGDTVVSCRGGDTGRRDRAAQDLQAPCLQRPRVALRQRRPGHPVVRRAQDRARAATVDRRTPRPARPG